MSRATREAFKSVVDLVPTLDARISCIEFSEPFLFIGTQTGQIYRLRVSSSGVDSKFDWASWRPDMELGRRPVDQLRAMRGTDYVIALCDGKLTFFRATSMTTDNLNVPQRDISKFCLNEAGYPNFGLCLSVKKKLVLYSWSASAHSFQPLKELAVPDVPLSMMYYSHFICVGYQREYNILVDTTGEVLEFREDVVHLDSKTLPLIKYLPGEVLLLSGAERAGVFVKFDGSPLPRDPVKWLHRPEVIGYCFPYILSISARSDTVEVHDCVTGAFVQSIGLPTKGGGACDIIDCRVGKEDAAKGRNHVFVAISHPPRVVMIQPVPYEKQVEQLLRRRDVTFAQLILENTTDEALKEERLGWMYIDAGRVLFLSLEFEAACELFSKSTLDARELLSLYPELQSPEFKFHPTFFSPELTHGIVSGTLSPADGASSSYDSDGGKSRGGDVGGASGGAGGPGGGAGSALPTDLHPASLSDIVRVVLRRFSNAPIPDDALTGRAQEQITNSYGPLCKFLERQRQAQLETASIQLMAALDTAIFKIYVFMGRVEDLEKFVLVTKSLDMVDSRALLEREGLVHVLALLYQGAHMEREALSVWRDLGTGVHSEPGYDGVKDTVAFLSASNNKALIFEFAPWVLKRRPEVGMDIFLKSKRSPALPHDVVLRFLEELPDLHDQKLRTKFLEYLVNEVGAKEERFHTELAREYMRNVFDLRETMSKVLASATKRDRDEPGTEPGRLGHFRGKLLTLLRTSMYYDAISLLDFLLRCPTLFEERVVLYQRVGDHRRALGLLVYELADHPKAEAYCVEQYNLLGMESDAFVTLLRLYLDPDLADDARADAFRSSAMNLLHRHATKVNAMKVMQLVPKSVPLATLMPFLEQAIPTSAHRVRESLIVKSMYKYEDNRVRVLLADQEERQVVVQRKTYCRVCGKWLGDSILVILPDNTPIHKYCYRAKLDM